MTAVVLIMLGGTVGFFTAALCKAAGIADREIELLEEKEIFDSNFILSEEKNKHCHNNG